MDRREFPGRFFGKNFEAKSSGTASSLSPEKMEHVELLGCVNKLKWNQLAESLTIEKSMFVKSCTFASKIRLA